MFPGDWLPASSDAWFDNILKQQHVFFFFMQHGTDSDTLPAAICSPTVFVAVYIRE